MKRLPFVLVAAVAGCAPHISVSTLNAPPHALIARAPAAVQVFASHVPDSVVDVYLIEASGGPDEDRLPAIRERAGQLGCDGLTINGAAPDTESSTVAWGGRGGVGNAETTNKGYMSAVCFVFAAPGAPGAP